MFSFSTAFYHRLPFLDSLIRILINLYLKIILFYFLKFFCPIQESNKKVYEENVLESLQRLKMLREKVLETMIKRLCCTRKDSKTSKMLFFLSKKIKLVSIMIQMCEWWNSVFCVFAYIKYDFFSFPHYLFGFFI